jgi:hypothetical protein
MPRAIHFGLRRPGIRGGCGVPDGAAGAIFCLFVFAGEPPLRGLVSIVMVSFLNIGEIS